MTRADLTLSVTRTLDAPRDAVWRCWTEGDLLRRWFCPAPWTVPVADLDPRPGGRMNVTMAGPGGERVEGVGCYLEVAPGERLDETRLAAAMAGTPMELPEEDIERHERSGPESERLAASIAASAP